MNILYITKIVLIVLITIVLFYAFYRYLFNRTPPKKDIGTKSETPTAAEKLVLYHASWCGHCKTFMPEWDKFAKHAQQHLKHIDVIKIQCDSNKDTCKLNFIKGFPTVALHKKNGEIVVFQDDRTMEKLLKFVNNHL